jgi:bifunctional N-acetylglucosamine-1-phosphate-uridyltransferase/glucosamine-1-phosphate-acetyltransferase GlmU-like protein
VQLVVLAAGSGVRFGGVKQLAPVGPNGEAILDVLLERAAHARFTAAIVVTAPAIEEQVRAHLDAHLGSLPVRVVLQAAPRGTVDAVLAARQVIEGPFAVVNADDLYPPDAFAMLASHLSSTAELALVAFRVGSTLIGPRPVKRALLDIDDQGRLVAIRESTVAPGTGGLRGDEWVSMNMWGFAVGMLETFAQAVADFMAAGADGEVLLPDVVGALVLHGASVRVLGCDQGCIGITYAEDVDVVRAALS